jgi:phenylalanyl-tRNA synthetase beta chain
MKISYNWLKQFLALDIQAEALAQVLTQAGLEVEHLAPIQLLGGKVIEGGLAGLVIGEVKTCEKHPNADKLSKTTVEIAPGQIVPIVCGAPNVAAGQKVIVATVGTRLYPQEGESFEIKKAKIRGEASEGMICAEDEIGIGHSHEGIMVLDTPLPVGTPAAEYLGLEQDFVLEIGLTPNRVDAASHLGVARDLRVLLDKQLSKPSVAAFQAKAGQRPLRLSVENQEACPRYSGLCISGVRVAESPAWLKNRLVAIGLSPINNIVDITNYVLHELGQPLHAFDADKIAGDEVIIKTLPSGTKFTTLDGQERSLHEQDLMICNAQGPMCIAGVFGGLDSGISEGTTRIFLESAYFSADYVRRTAQRHGLKTDAAFRFERGADPQATVYALQRAALLIVEIAGGEISSELYDLYPQPIAPFRFLVRYKNITRLIGQEIPRESIHQLLRGLEIEIDKENQEDFEVSVPPYRVDVQREVDIIEEILRLYGYNRIEAPAHLSASFIANFPKKDPHALQHRSTELLAASGFSEIITNSLTKPLYAESLKSLDPAENVVILNKLSEELEVLRQSLLFSGLEVMSYNFNRKQKDLKLFEFGKVYRKTAQGYQEESKLALFVSGNQQGESWTGQQQKADYHFLAGIALKLLASLRLQPDAQQAANPHLFAYGLEYLVGKEPVMQVGLVQPRLCKVADFKQPVLYAEIAWEKVLAISQASMSYREVPKFPEVRRDLSLILDKSVSFAQIQEKAYQIERKLLKGLNVFSVYEGENIGEGKISYAISFTLQDESQTLTDKVIDKTMQRLMEGFTKDFQALIRS